MNRYDWEDALVDAQTTGQIPDGALLVALKLARAINWCPKDGRPAGLYWKNDDAFEKVGVARATYYRHQKSLIETGFIVMRGGNILPAIPQESQLETVDTTEKSQIETTESQIETEKSQVDNPFSVDSLSEDVLSEKDTVSDEPVEPEVREVRGTDSLVLLTTESTNMAHTILTDDRTRSPRILTPGEKQVVDTQVRIYKLDNEGQTLFFKFVRQTPPSLDIYEAAKQALRSIGIEMEEDDW